jgi:predicted regulator of Ras-like GTPase activity (Roadblock/LC7/MglB family)
MVGRFDPDLSQLIVDEEAGFEIGALLKWLLRDSRASSAMVLDEAGQIIVQRGDAGGDLRVQLGALIAGVFASTREVARILGERDFRSFIQEGAGNSVLAESIGGQWLLAVIFETNAQLGLVKLLSGRTAIELNGVLERTLERNRLRPKLKDLGIQIVANDTIDLLFRDDVAKQWTED